VLIGIFGILVLLACYLRSGEILLVAMVPFLAALAMMFLYDPPGGDSGMELPDWDFD
jgi:hypothetical protein